jgi:hypothetical protein
LHVRKKLQFGEMRLEKCGLSRYVAGFDTPTIAEVADSIRDVYRSILNCDPFFEATIQELILEVTLGSRFKFTDVFWSVRDSRILRTRRRVDPRGNPHGWRPGTAEGEKNY